MISKKSKALKNSDRGRYTEALNILEQEKLFMDTYKKNLNANFLYAYYCSMFVVMIVFFCAFYQIYQIRQIHQLLTQKAAVSIVNN